MLCTKSHVAALTREMDVVARSPFDLAELSASGRGSVSSTLRDVMGEHLPFVWRTLRRHGVREPDLPDQCQEVFLVVHRKLDEFRGESSLRTWLYGIALRVAAGYRRKAHVTRESPEAAPPDSVLEAGQEQDLERKRALDRLRVLLAEVEPARREVFVLYELEELSMSEVAKVVGCPLRTAYAWYDSVRAHVQRRWEATP